MDSFSGDQWRDKRKSSCDYRCDYSDGFSNNYLIMVAHEDCMSKAGVLELSWQPLISRDCAVEAG